MVFFAFFLRLSEQKKVNFLFKQIHLVKPSSSSDVSLSVPASQLRPISIFSVLWRAYASARLKSACVARWINRVLPAALCGGRRGSDVLSIMLLLFEHVDNNRFLGSLDFSKAFGHVRPLSAGAAMVHTGCPAGLVRGILSVWRQRRLLCWGSSVHHKFIGVTESMPQGDPFAVLALGFLLRIPVLKLQARFPRLLQVIYVDDRTWCCDSAAECVEVWNCWERESARLGFRENHSKAQFFHRTAQGRKALKTRGCAASHTVTILGVEVSSSESRGSSKKELARFQRAMTVLRKCRYLHHGVLRKAHLCTSAAMSAVSWGWCQRAPPNNLVDKLRQGWRVALDVVRQSSWSLVQLLVGHGSDILFTSGCLLFSAYARLGHKGLLGDITWGRSHGTVHRLRSWLGDLGWFEIRPWCWRSGRVCIDLLNVACLEDIQGFQHALRSSWRVHQWNTHRESGRRDSQVGPLDLDSVAVARSYCLEYGKHAFSILTGGYVSDARIHAGTVCSFCDLGEISGREHEWWVCPAHTTVGCSRPHQAAAALLCWPVGTELESSRARVQHVVNVRKTRLRHRYDS